MCLAIPGQIRRIELGEGGARTAEVDYPGLTKTVSLLYLPDAEVGDHILVQAGFGIRRLTPEEAAEVLAALDAEIPGSAAPPIAAGGPAR